MRKVAFLERYRPTRLNEVAGNESAKRAIRGIVLGGDQHILLHGLRGCGKSSLARIIMKALACERRVSPDINPCGACAACKRLDSSGLGTDYVVVTRNGAELTRAMIKQDFELAMYSWRYMFLCYDELAYAPKDIQALLLTLLEQPEQGFWFIGSAADLNGLEPALLQRLQPVGVAPPTREQMMSRLRRIAELEGATEIQDDVLRDICDGNDSIPRRCVNTLGGLLAQTKVLSWNEFDRLRSLPVE